MIIMTKNSTKACRIRAKYKEVLKLYQTSINSQNLSQKDQWDDLFLHIVKRAYHRLVHFTSLTPALSPIKSI